MIEVAVEQIPIAIERRRLKDFVYPAIFLAILFALDLHTAYTRSLWFDELSTLFVVSTPTLRGMLHAIPADGNPPLYFLLARAFSILPVKPEAAVRLPAIFAFLCTAFSVYLFVRRRTGARYAFLAMALVAGSFVGRYGYEGRPYTLLLFFTTFTLCCWQRAGDDEPRMALVGIACGVAGAILTHQYGVIYALTPLIAGEVVRAWRRRRADWPVIGAALISLPLLLLTYPPTLRAQKPLLDAIRACPVFWAHPRFSDLGYYSNMFPTVIPLLVLFVAAPVLLAYLVARKKNDTDTIPGIPIEEIAAAGAAPMLLPVMLLVTHFGTNYFQERYGIGSAVGIAILVCIPAGTVPCAISNRSRYCIRLRAQHLRRARLHSIQLQPDPLLTNNSSSEPIVVASALEFSSAWWYANPQLRERLHSLVDLSYAGQHSDIIPEFSLALEKEYTPMQMEDYQRFLSTHDHFLLYSYGQPRLEWINQRLTAEGWHLKRLQSVPNPRMPHDEGQTYREIYEVTRTEGH